MSATLKFLTIIVIVTLVSCDTNTNSLLSADNLKVLTNQDDEPHFNEMLRNILIPRIVGSPGHKKVQNFIASELRSLGAAVELDQFVDSTPTFGNLTFKNIIGRFNPDANEFLALACHYDSKYFPNQEFLAATDSAVPCAMMLNLAKTILPILDWTKGQRDIGLMLIFFDGEEAFKDWSDTDSLYGSRHLAKKFHSVQFQLADKRTVREIERIEVMVLLDLLGGPDTRFVSLYQQTKPLYMNLYTIERLLAKQRLLKGGKFMFFRNSLSAQIDDDHAPFLERGVPILHLISVPFPSFWHTPADNAENLDRTSITNFNRILRVFIVQYLMNHDKNTLYRKL